MKNLLLIFAGLLLFTNLSAQKMMRFSPDEAVILFEIKRVITLEDGNLVVGQSLARRHGNEKPKFNINDGDKVIYINGKKVESIKSLSNEYESIEEGKEVKLGILRGKERLIVSFERSKKLPAGMKMRREKNDESKKTESTKGN